MSNYLGFQPSDTPNYYFVSYDNEDAERVGLIASRLSHSNVPLWYDYGIEYGEKWEAKISEKLSNTSGMILFFTKAILMKENSYVRKEYTMATDYFHKKLYIVLLDEIEKNDVPVNKVSWWIDIQEQQCINLVGVTDYAQIVKKITEALGVATHEDKMNQMIVNYRSLYDVGMMKEAEEYLAEYLKGQTLFGKAKCIADICTSNIEGIQIESSAVAINARSPLPLLDHRGRKIEFLDRYIQRKFDNVVFTFGQITVAHRFQGGDMDVINIWKNDKNIHTVLLANAVLQGAYYDRLEDIIYLVYHSEFFDGSDYNLYLGVSTVENPAKKAICNDFSRLVFLRKY